MKDPKRDLDTAIHILDKRGELIFRVAQARGIPTDKAREIVDEEFPLDQFTEEFLQEMSDEIDVWVAMEEKGCSIIQ